METLKCEKTIGPEFRFGNEKFEIRAKRGKIFLIFKDCFFKKFKKCISFGNFVVNKLKIFIFLKEVNLKSNKPTHFVILIQNFGQRRQAMEGVAKYFTNARGNKQLIDSANHVYYCKRKTESGLSYWRCANKTCSGRANVDEAGKVSVVSEHNHGSNIAALEAHLQALDAIQMAKDNPNMRPRQILGNMAVQNSDLSTVLSKRPEESLTR